MSNDISCWNSFARYHRAVGLALLSAAHSREAAHHFSTAAISIARATSLLHPANWEDLRELALLLASCSALSPHTPLEADRLMQLVNRLGASPSQALPPLKQRLCEPQRSPSEGRHLLKFTPFVAAAATYGGRENEEWPAFIESAGLDAAVALFRSASTRGSTGAKIFRMQRLVTWMRDSGIVMPIVL
jgi:hypothetical protein